MRALQITAPGAPLEAVTLPDPVPGRGEILVRIEAAGICRSDVHYRSGTRPVPRLPLVPGHEIAGTVVGRGDDVHLMPGTRVALHYLVSCGRCAHCSRGAEQFCDTGAMLGLDRQGGYAEFVVVPERNAHAIPPGVSTGAGAVMMCSTATSLHALRRGRVGPGTAVALLGAGGLGMSAIQLARVLGAEPVFAVDIEPSKLRVAAELGALPIDGREDAVAEIQRRGGVDVALELVGSADLMRDAVRMLRPGGRAVAVGITDAEFGLDPYRDLIKIEAEILGAADHLSSEIDEILTLAADGSIDVDRLITRTVPLEADAVESVLVDLERFQAGIRTVIEPV
jgi:2-desacetyl-2-hydroxyethyl bacteriochlorophyllide A dehydrogenase